MAKRLVVTEEQRKAELIANWLIIYNDPEKGESKRQKAEELCVYNGLEPGQFQRILDGEFRNMTFKELLDVYKIINRKWKVPPKAPKEKGSSNG